MNFPKSRRFPTPGLEILIWILIWKSLKCMKGTTFIFILVCYHNMLIVPSVYYVLQVQIIYFLKIIYNVQDKIKKLNILFFILWINWAYYDVCSFILSLCLKLGRNLLLAKCYVFSLFTLYWKIRLRNYVFIFYTLFTILDQISYL